MTKKTYELSGRTFSKEITFTKTRPTTVIDKSPTSTIGNTSYTYDAMGRIKSIDNGESITYEYDSYGQLEKETNNILDKTIEYEYNEIGNLLSVTTTPFGGTATTTTFTYGNTSYPDRLTRVGSNSIAYNSMGCIASYNSRIYRWERGKLAGYTRESQTGLPYENCVYTYNAYGQRVSKTYTYDPNPAVANDASYTYTTTYTYDNSGRLIREYTTETHNINGASTREFIYLYDEVGMIGCVYTAGGASSSTYFYVRNLQGDVVGIFDSSGNKIAEYDYDAFGNCTTVYGLASSIGKYNPIRYRGYYCDIETNWYFLNARYYAPELRRFISPDDTAYLDPESVNGLNLYAYCNNDPVNYCDPSGHFSFLILGISIGVSLLFEVIDDYLDGGFGDGSHDPGDYLGALISGFFGALGGGLASQVAFAFVGGLADAVLSGDLEEDGFWKTMCNITLSSVVSFGIGHSAKRIASGIKSYSLKRISQKIGNNVANRQLRAMGTTIKIGSNAIKHSRTMLSKVIYDSNWIIKDISEVLFGSISGGIFSQGYGYVTEIYGW